MGEFGSLISRVKGNDKEIFGEIIKKMAPVIDKYVRKSFWCDSEDARQEYVLSIWEAIMKMEYINHDGQCVKYLHQAVENRYHELQRKNTRIKNYEDKEAGLALIDTKGSIDTEIENFLTIESIKKVISEENGKKYDILYASYIEEKSVAEIANRNNLSRQYVNQIRKKYRLLLQKKLY